MKPGIDPNQFRQLIIRPALEALGGRLWSPSAENLLMGTAAQESRLGNYIHQLGRGPAVGPFQMEPATHDDIWERYLRYKRWLNITVHEAAGIEGEEKLPADYMIYNLRYAAAMARIHYLRVPQALPEADDIEGLAAYWKRYYNTYLGAGTVEEFIENYHRFVL